MKSLLFRGERIAVIMRLPVAFYGEVYFFHSKDRMELNGLNVRHI